MQFIWEVVLDEVSCSDLHNYNCKLLMEALFTACLKVVDGKNLIL